MIKFAKILTFLIVTFCFSETNTYLATSYIMQGSEDGSYLWDLIGEINRFLPFNLDYSMWVDICLAISWCIFASVWAYVVFNLYVADAARVVRLPALDSYEERKKKVMDHNFQQD